MTDQYWQFQANLLLPSSQRRMSANVRMSASDTGDKMRVSCAMTAISHLIASIRLCLGRSAERVGADFAAAPVYAMGLPCAVAYGRQRIELRGVTTRRPVINNGACDENPLHGLLAVNGALRKPCASFQKWIGYAGFDSCLRSPSPSCPRIKTTTAASISSMLSTLTISASPLP